MIPFDEARSIVLAHAAPLGTERLELAHLLGRYLAEPVISQIDIPSFDNSAMDGFGVRAADVALASESAPVILTVSATTRAGDPVAGQLAPRSAVKLLTGAPVPPGVEAVVMSEYTRESDGSVIITRPVQAGENIRNRGEEFRKGDAVVPIGARLTPPAIGLIATVGAAVATVYVQPKVAVLITGSELVQPGEPRQPHQIYDSNSIGLSTALTALGFARHSLAHARDDLAAIEQQLRHALAQADVTIAVGGVSVGEYDLVKEACSRLGVTTRFWQVAMKPAKPTYYGTYPSVGSPEKLIFGLPGNPVAALVAFHQFVKPALLKMMDAAEVLPPILHARLAAAVRKKRGRLEFLRGFASTEDGRLVARPTTGQGSHMLGGLAQANCLIRFPAGAEQLSAGDDVEIEFISWER